jgi:hypothetical protein
VQLAAKSKDAVPAQSPHPSTSFRDASASLSSTRNFAQGASLVSNYLFRHVDISSKVVCLSVDRRAGNRLRRAGCARLDGDADHTRADAHRRANGH